MSESKLKVLHVLDHSAPRYDGYAFRSADIIRFQRALGLRTVQVTSAKHGMDGAAVEEFDGLRFHRTAPGADWRAKLPVLDQWDVVSTLAERLRGLIAEEEPDLLHVHSPALNGLAALRAVRASALPVVYEVRSFWEDAAVDKGACREGDLRYRVSRALETRVVRRADAVVCICEGLRADIAARGVARERLSVVANAVDVERFSEASSPDPALAGRLGLSAGRTLGFIGSFFAFEGLGVLVEAMKHLLATDPRWRLLLVGDGVCLPALRAQARASGLAEQVIFTGRVPQAEVGRYYDLVDLFVYPRISMRITELVTPLKPLEAMTKGRLVLASDVGGHRELVRDGETGVLFRAGDPADLAARASELLGRPDGGAEMARAARAYVLRERDWRRNVERYLDIYDRALARRGRIAA